METGIGIGTVFVILILLVGVLTVFGSVAKKGAKPAAKPAAAPAPAAPKATAAPATSASEDEKAAIATALYLYFQNVHVEESGVITIKHNPNTAWHHELNQHVLK